MAHGGYHCDECDEFSEELREVGGQDLCPCCADEWLDAEDYEAQVRADYRASAL